MASTADETPLRIDRRNGLPLHAQIDALLRDLIRQPKYAAGALLPDEVSLARQLGVSRSTLRAGMQKLIYEGLVERRQGHGTRVSSHPPLQSGVSEWHSLTGEMQSHGIEVTNYDIRLELTRPSVEVQNALQLRSDRPVWMLRRLRGWLGERVVLTVSWMHPRLGIKGDEDFSRPLYNVISEVSGITATRSLEDITACLAESHLARDFEIPPGSALLLRRRTTLDNNDEPIEYNLNWYRSDIHSLRLDLRRG
ncbi:MAG: GntR family transcriptional regulator [Fimbriimonas sp.]|nr:GntR family transcriptional regulator [Fimbriimonas sp.]